MGLRGTSYEFPAQLHTGPGRGPAAGGPTVTAHLTSKVAGLVGWGGSRLPLPAPRIAVLLLSHRWWVTSGSMCSTSAFSPDSIQNDEVSALPAEVLPRQENARVHWGPVLV